MAWHAKIRGGYTSSSEEGRDNATEMASVFTGVGWSVAAISACLGNSAGEGGLNPWRWESDIVPTYQQYLDWTAAGWDVSKNHGMGLFGFTPAATYIENSIAKAQPGYGPNFSDRPGKVTDGAAQTYLMANGYVEQNWNMGDADPGYRAAFAAIGIDYEKFRIPYSQFVAGNASIDVLTGAFELRFEKPSASGASSTYNGRVQNANAWYEYFTGHPPTPPKPTEKRYGWLVAKNNRFIIERRNRL